MLRIPWVYKRRKQEQGGRGKRGEVPPLILKRLGGGKWKVQKVVLWQILLHSNRSLRGGRGRQEEG